MKTALIPDTFAETASALAMSPAIISGNHIFLTGITGSAPDGAMPTTPEAQFNAVFAKAAGILALAKLPMDAIVEMTSYHIGLRAHFEVFEQIRRATFPPLTQPGPRSKRLAFAAKARLSKSALSRT